MGHEVEHYPDPWWARHPFLAVIGIALACLILSGIGWGVKVALSPVKGAGDVIIQQNDADNMINSQRELVKRYEGLKAACARISIAKTAADGDPTYTNKQNYTAAKASYQTLVAEYNALTQQLLAKNMLGDLPAHVSPDNCIGVNR